MTQVGHVHGNVVFTAPPRAEREVPHQVPGADRWFVNRRAELANLDGGHSDGHDDSHDDGYGLAGGARITLVTGVRGVGKSALVRRWAGTATGRFPGGELYVDFAALRSPSGAGAIVGEALAGCLRGLGVDEAYLPTSLPERANLFRTRTATAPVLVVLDDVTEPAQVVPLVPTATGSAVVVTCDRRLGELVGSEGAELLVVDPLADDHARDLLAAICPAQVADADPADVATLVRLCGGLPIALRVAGARLRTDRGLAVADLVEEVVTGLDALSVGGEARVMAVFDAAYRALPEQARRAYRIFGAADGLELTVETVSVALDAAPPAGRAVLAALVAANLVEEHRGRRYRWYTLVARHAAAQAADAAQTDAARADAAQTDAAQAGLERDGDAALRRLVHYYLVHAMAADAVVMGARLRYARLDQVLGGEPAPLAGAGKARALQWLADERTNLLQVVRLAGRLGDDEAVWQLAEALAALYLNQRRPYELVEVCESGVAAAGRLGRGEVAARLRCVASRGHLDLGRHADARTHLDAALQYAETHADLRLLASVCEFRGRLADAEGDLPAAIAAYTRSLEHNEAAGEARGAAIARYFLGCAVSADGRPGEALPLLSVATRALLDRGDDRMAARALLATGEALARLGRDGEGAATLREAVAVFAKHRTSHYEAQALEILAEVTVRLGDPAQARAHLTRAIAILDGDDPRVARLRASLAALPPAWEANEAG